jgi:hypothetical protein
MADGVRLAPFRMEMLVHVEVLGRPALLESRSERRLPAVVFQLSSRRGTALSRTVTVHSVTNLLIGAANLASRGQAVYGTARPAPTNGAAAPVLEAAGRPGRVFETFHAVYLIGKGY